MQLADSCIYVRRSDGVPFIFNRETRRVSKVAQTSSPGPSAPRPTVDTHPKLEPLSVNRAIKSWRADWPTEDTLRDLAAEHWGGEIWHTWVPLDRTQLNYLRNLEGFVDANTFVARFRFDEARDDEFPLAKFHAASISAFENAVAMGDRRLAVGLSITKSLGPGIYLSDTPRGAFQYIRGGNSANCSTDDHQECCMQRKDTYQPGT